jgi:tetratricopeptide (TPR) repeat protein
MKSTRTLAYVLTLIAGIVIGYFGRSYISSLALQNEAEANLFVSGESLRRGDLVDAMTHAQSALNQAPRAYSPYEAIGDIYARFGLPSAARTMYKKAISRLTLDRENAMLAAKGAVSPEAAADLVRRKLSILPSRDSPTTCDAQGRSAEPEAARSRTLERL